MAEISYSVSIADVPTRRTRQGASSLHTLVFAITKHTFDVICALGSLPIILLMSVLLFVLNPFLNPGKLFYSQKRMGKHGRPFTMVKFRTMVAETDEQRGHDCKLEEDRITSLGRFLRRYRLDELPNMFNVLLRQMSVIGPRPDTWEHAVEYAKVIPHYNNRHRVRPGITGLAQVEMGYAEGTEQTKVKAHYDGLYIEAYGFRQEVHIVARTFKVLSTGFGAR